MFSISLLIMYLGAISSAGVNLHSRLAIDVNGATWIYKR